MKLLSLIMMAFGGLVGAGRSRTKSASRPAVRRAAKYSKPETARMPSQRRSAEVLVEAEPNMAKHEQKRSKLSASKMKDYPVESKRMIRSGGRVGGRVKAPTNVGEGDKSIPMGPWYFKGPQKSSTVIHHTEGQDENSPPPPINVYYEHGQVGSSKRLDEYKKMYKGSLYELDTKTLMVNEGNQKFQPSTMCGFGRKQVHWPYWLNDHFSNEANQLTSRQSCFNRFQLENLFFKMWEKAGISQTRIQKLIDDLSETEGGDIRVEFPLDYIECEYKYFNNNKAMPIDLQLYVCCPKRDLTAMHNPMVDWFEPGTAAANSDFEKMLPDYYYEPVLTGAQDVMFNNNSGTISNVAMRANCKNILAASTEVVVNATPQSYSIKFDRNWDVRTMQPFILEPQQELCVTFRVKMKKPLDIKKLLAFGYSSDLYEIWANMSMFPMVTYQGQDTTGVSKNLERDGASADMNRFLDTTAPRGAESMLSSSMKARARVHTKTTGIRNFVNDDYDYTLGDVLDVFSVSKKELLSYNDAERGQQVPYFQVNDNLGYFCDKTTKPTSNYHLTQLVELNLKPSGSTLAPSVEPATALLTPISTNGSWGVVESKTISRARLEKTGSDISPD